MKRLTAFFFTWLACILARASDVAPDFKLIDANPSSARRTQKVSPRDYLLQVSGFYFGAAH